MNPSQMFELLNVPFAYTRRPSPLSAELRPEWRIPLVLLMLLKCRNSRANLKQLHALNWALRNDKTQDAFIRALSGIKNPASPLIRYEPSLTRAIAFAVGEKLLKPLPDGLVTFTEKGLLAAQRISNDTECFKSQKMFLGRISSKLTQTQIDKLLRSDS